MSRPRRGAAGWGLVRDAYLNADVQQQPGSLGAVDFDAFSQFEPRKLRYDLFWALWQNNAFRDRAHLWAPALKETFGLGRYTRNVFNPVHRLVEFHVAHLLGGRLDPKAGDGEAVKSAVPVLTENEAIRPALAQLWRDEKFQAAKSVWTRYGACLGDPAFVVDDDPSRRRVTRRVVHPGHVKWVDRDCDGNVTAYVLEQWRYDPRAVPVAEVNPSVSPRATRRVVRYNEKAFLRGGRCVFQTYLNGAPFDWRRYSGDGAELPAEWETPYPFVPMVMAPHLDVGLPFGVAECHALISKAFEVDDQASGLGDQIRKRIRAPKLLAGMRNPDAPGSYRTTPHEPGEGRTGRFDQYGNQQGRQDMDVVYGPADAKVLDMTNDLDTPGVRGYIQEIVAEVERDYPELQMDIWATGDPSGRALRVARQRTENKIQERRTGYDAALVMSHKMALAMGAARGYPGYEGMGFDPHEPGPLDHEIGHRPVFSPDPLDDIEEGTAFWAMAGAAVQAGMPLEEFLRSEGWDEADVARITATKARNAADAIRQQQATGATTVQMTGGGDRNPPEKR